MIDYAREYDNSGRVPNSKELLEAFWGNAARFREAEGLIVEHGLAYGREERNRLDMFWPSTEEGKAKDVPIVLFIHGGYWRSLDRTAFSHLAYGLLLNNIAVAMPSYTLCPDIDLGGIINEMRRACLLIFQTYKKPITVVGHSAGGHLAACMLATDWDGIHPDLPYDLVTSAMGISGIYDLLPITHTPINDDLRLDAPQAAAASPVRWVPEASQRFEAWVGSEESEEYHRQSRELAERWTLLGTPTEYVIVDGTNHFTVVDQLTDPLSPMVQRIVDIVDRPKVDFESDLETDEPEAVAEPVPEQTAEELVDQIEAAADDLAGEQENPESETAVELPIDEQTVQTADQETAAEKPAKPKRKRTTKPRTTRKPAAKKASTATKKKPPAKTNTAAAKKTGTKKASAGKTGTRTRKKTASTSKKQPEKAAEKKESEASPPKES